ncbi:peptidoglycan D,D-transpeptidase FtsI family protein [Sphingomicrobium flavum]|uniref:peptidoglycan D,D-transpeptidase FtsI family protein n=1 Tax=Sphingomicrobium flavum TaxID=1229164 RepID=UPI0021AD7D1A|nr:penicillin-binding protein 2 [Sphingomicrobium flavum]
MNAHSPNLVAKPDRLRLVGQKRKLLSMMHQRLMLGLLLFAGAIALVGVRIGWLAVFGDASGRSEFVAGFVPERGDIVDRDGEALARTIDAWSIAVQPKKIIGSKMELAQSLATIFPDRSAAELYDMLTADKNFAYLQRRASPSMVEAVNALGEPGIQLMREPDRLYPQTALAAHVIGYTDVDGNGVAGAERGFDAWLTDPARRAEPVQLAISSRIQQALKAELAAAMEKFSAIGAAGVIMDIHTGEILAMTSLPQLNPNVAGQGSDDARFNRATVGVYELGSTFKPFTVAMAMDAGIVKSFSQMYPCPEKLKVGNRLIGDTHPFGRACSVAEIMQESSNVGTAQIALQLGAKRQKEFLKKMGFLSRLDFELPERSATLYPSDWSEVATATVGYGHGISVSPLHLATGYAALFNGGIHRKPTILKVGPGHPADKGERVFSEDTSYKMRALMRLVVTEGTGRKADAPGYRVGGKTGTAEKVVNGRYVRQLVVNSFAGVFPMDEPRYVAVVMLDEPKGTKETYGFRTAGWNVAPVVSGTISRIAPMLGVRPDMEREPDMSTVLPYVELKD